MRYRLTALYIITPILILLVSALLMLHILGYRFNLNDREITQGGLLQLDSRPAGATVTVDSKKIDGRTPNRTDLSSGLHTVMMQLDGYRPWQKTVNIDPGRILWLNYARLFPKELQVAELNEFPLTAASLAARNGKVIAVMPRPDQARITLLKIQGDTVKPTELDLPEDLYADKAKSSFQMVAWSEDGRYILMKHRYTNGSEWLSIDTEAIDQSVNATNIAGQAISQVDFMAKNPRQLYVLANQSVRIIDTRSMTISAPIINGVSEFSQSSQGILAYTSVRDAKTNQRTVGYYTKGAAKPYPIRTVYDDGSKVLRIRIGEYVRKQYIALQYGSTVEVNLVALGTSDSTQALTQSSLVTIAVPDTTSTVSFSPANRFVLMVHQGGFMTYDLELGALASTPLRGLDKTYQLDWLDGAMLWSDRGGEIVTYEFDGNNIQEITPVATGQAVVLSNNQKSLYGFRQVDGVLRLVQVSLIAS